MQSACRQQLLQMLNSLLDKEELQWQCPSYQSYSDSEFVSNDQRQSLVQWLAWVVDYFGFHSDTLSLTVTLYDRFVTVTKVKVKYMKCVGITCLYLAAKIKEEDDVIPTTATLVSDSLSGCSVAETVRMERCILSKLNWQIDFITSLDFLIVYKSLLLSHYPTLLDNFPHITATTFTSRLIEKHDLLLSSAELLKFTPSTVAMAIISLELELFSSSWLTVIVILQQVTKIDNRDIVWCREIISRNLGRLHLDVNFYFPCGVKRKHEIDDIYEDIQKLYADESHSKQPISSQIYTT